MVLVVIVPTAKSPPVRSAFASASAAHAGPTVSGSNAPSGDREHVRVER
jgi:hypothetical protein